MDEFEQVKTCFPPTLPKTNDHPPGIASMKEECEAFIQRPMASASSPLTFSIALWRQLYER
jgi:hypothetical protein